MTLSVEYKSTDSLIPYVNNSRTHSKKQVQQVAASIKEFGFTNPILVDEEGGIIAGHGRLQAAEMLKMREVPTILLAGLTEAQKKAYVIADNQLALNADWNLDALKLEVESLTELSFDLDLLGFDDDFLLDLQGLGDDENAYTQKVEAPTYEPTGEKPDVKDLFNSEKTSALIDEINAAEISDEERAFLLLAAGRHTAFDFEMIANYYAHSDETVQQLMENSALVIIDFNKAIEQGYVIMGEKLRDQYTAEYADAEQD